MMHSVASLPLSDCSTSLSDSATAMQRSSETLLGCVADNSKSTQTFAETFEDINATVNDVGQQISETDNGCF